MGDFKEALSNCNLYDLGFSGVLFTWCNNWEGNQRILKSLDHALENDAWTSLFSNVGVIHGCVAYSDHCPIWQELYGSQPKTRRKRLFRFEEMLIGEKECDNIIKQAL